MADGRMGAIEVLRRCGASALASALLMLGVLVVLPSSAHAYENVEPGFSSFTATPSSAQAGGHPDVHIDYTVREDGFECSSGCLAPRRVGIHWPEGFIGNPHVATKCTLSEFSTSTCPSNSQIGKYMVNFGLPVFGPVYNMQTRPDQAGLLAFLTPIITAPVFLELSSRTDGDYGLDAISSPMFRSGIPRNQLELWGVPASPEHDVERFRTPLVGVGVCYIGVLGPDVEGCPPDVPPYVSATYAPATVPPAPFLQNPTTCGIPLTLTGTVEYYGGVEGSEEVPWPATTGCQQASFTPSATAKPTTSATDAPSGLDAKLRVPQTQSPVTPAPSELKEAKVTLPEGFSINPGAADGKVACPDGFSGIGTLFAASCPEHAKIGTLTLDVAALPAPIPGALYLAEPKPGEPYRVLLTASGFATNVKLVGRADADPRTGQVSLTFDSLPQSPLQEFDLHIFGSERGLLATPTHCGTYEVESEFVPWNSLLATRTTKSTITIDSGPNGAPCPTGPRAVAPSLEAGVANTTAGKHTSFSLLVSRDDGEQNTTGLTVATPAGFAATLRGVSYCSEAAVARLGDPAYAGLAEQASPACPAQSQIGTAVAGAGAGSHPLYVPGKVYLAGPYKGAPLSLAVVVPAVSGPYDLGNISVRAAIHVDPATAQITAVSDPLPQILDGIPLRTRTILINLDRPEFALNPTNCDPSQVGTTVSGDEGGGATLARRFQVANCADLPYAPKLDLRLVGGVKRLGHPAVQATFMAGAGEANTRSVSVTLPQGQQLDNSHIGTVCTRPAFAADACPARSLLGTAEAKTPLLDAPLRGNVYLRASGRKLPDLVLDLEGQIDIELVGRIDTAKNGALRTTFAEVPDAPVSSFSLRLAGGAKGLLVNEKSLCGKPKAAAVRTVGQNAAVQAFKAKLKTSCGSKAKSKRHRRQSNSRKAG